MKRQDSLLRQTYRKVLESLNNNDVDPEVTYVLDKIQKLPESDEFLADFIKDIIEIESLPSGSKWTVNDVIGTMIENRYYEQYRGERSITGATEEVLSFLEQEYEKWNIIRNAKKELYKDNPGVNIDIGEATDDDEEDLGEWEPEDGGDEEDQETFFPYGNIVVMFKDKISEELNKAQSPYRAALEEFVEKDGPWPRSLNNAIQDFLLVLKELDGLKLDDPEYQGNNLFQKWYEDSIENYGAWPAGTAKGVEKAKKHFNDLFLIWCQELRREKKAKDTLYGDNPGVNIDI